MNNYEKVKFANGAVYDIAVGGFDATDEKLVLILLPGDKTLAQIDAETDNEEITSVIEHLDRNGDADELRKGYVYQETCQKQKDYVIERQAVESAEGDTEYRDVTETVVRVVLKKADLRKELDEAKAQIRDLNATIDMLVVGALEG